MKKNRLLSKNDILSSSLNNSNVVSIDHSEINKEIAAARGLALINVAKEGKVFNKKLLDNVIINKNIKPKSTNAKVKKPSESVSSSNTNDSVLRISVGDLLIPKKNLKTKDELHSVHKNVHNSESCAASEMSSKVSETKDKPCIVSDHCTSKKKTSPIHNESITKERISAIFDNYVKNDTASTLSEKSNSADKFKLPRASVRSKRSIVSLNSFNISSPILASSPIIQVTKRSRKTKDEFMSTSIVASSDTPARYNNTKSSLYNSIISPITKHKSADHHILSQKSKTIKKVKVRQSAPAEFRKPVVTRSGRVVRPFSDSSIGKYIYSLYNQNLRLR